jgi:hypothetical protein
MIASTFPSLMRLQILAIASVSSQYCINFSGAYIKTPQKFIAGSQAGLMKQSTKY